ncbi:DUF4376 domain-containing protein [Schauerella aestuarii]|uniref:DUF4376 domain-containing protein n=1 Tax=Schauerella aestuarii TaxID=2511204 RepID=UPI001369CAC4|nr:DUF4376 domain-containing protein [Achromobacter aestuarii]MYZ44226.1 DUF4376 domain-containing protein [Achromobacter aestuarii]
MPFFSPSTNGFYDDDDRPEDAVMVTPEQRNELLTAQYSGKAIVVIDGSVSIEDMPGPSLDDIRLATTATIEAWRDAEERAGVKFTFDGHEYDGGDKSRLRLQDSVASGIAAAGQFFWTDEANEDVPMDADSLAGLHSAMMAARVEQGFRIHVRQRQMKEEVAGLDVAGLAAYQVGWPPSAEPTDPNQPA